MKLEPFIYIWDKGSKVKISGGTTLTDDVDRADMYLPAWLFVVGLFLIGFGGILLTVAIAVQLPFFLGLLAVVLALLGMAAVMCWKNQTIRMLNQDCFEYSTFLGKKTVYRFSDIKELRKNTDSMTLFVADGKVHIESIAIVTDRLVERINRELTDSQWQLA